MTKGIRALSLPALLAAAALPATAPARAPGPPDKPAAVVNGETIPLAEVDALLQGRQKRGIPADEYREMQREALEMLIDDLLLQQFLRKHAPPVSASEVNRQFNELLSALKAQGQTFEAFCRENGQTEAAVRANILTTLQRKAFIDAHVGDAAARKYFDDNREFFDQVTVRVSHILLRPGPGASPADLEAARDKLRALRGGIVAGKLDFAAAARLHSQCPSGPEGGDIGYFPRKGAVEEPFARAAFALARGELSDVVRTSYGLHLIKLTDRRSGPPADFKTIAAKVREFAGEEMLLQIVARERASARVEIKLGAEEPAAKPASAWRSLLGGHRP